MGGTGIAGGGGKEGDRYCWVGGGRRKIPGIRSFKDAPETYLTSSSLDGKEGLMPSLVVMPEQVKG